MVTQLKIKKYVKKILLQEGVADHYFFMNCATYKNYHGHSS
jgi:hypothetical protein